MKRYEMILRSEMGVISRWRSWDKTQLENIKINHVSRNFTLVSDISYINIKVLKTQLEYLQPDAWYDIKGIQY